MLKTTYPALIMPTERGFRIEVPQFDITVEAEAAADGIQMARNQICTVLSSCVDTKGGGFLRRNHSRPWQQDPPQR